MKKPNFFLKQLHILQSYLHITSGDVLQMIAVGAYIILAFFMAICIFFAHDTMKQISIASLQDIEVTEIMSANAEAYGSSGTILGQIMNDERLKDLLGEVLAGKVDALLMRQDYFVITKEDVYSLLRNLIAEYDPDLTGEQVSEYMEYIYSISGASHVIETGNALEYRFSYYVLQEDVTDENRSDIEGAYHILSAMTSMEVPIFIGIFWVILALIIVYIGKSNLDAVLFQLLRSHITVLVVCSAIPISTLISGRAALGTFGEAFMVCLLLCLIVLFLAIILIIVPILLRRRHNYWTEEAKKQLEQIRAAQDKLK